MISQDARELASVLWRYHNIQQTLPGSVDLILVAGSHDDRVAIHGAYLAQTVPAKVLVASGGFGKITAGKLSEPEAVRFRNIMEENGVPSGRILTEETATNTGENITRSRDLLARKGVKVESGIVVTKPYMKRRALATAEKQWAEVSWWVSAPDIDFYDYPSHEVPERRMIELMVGDLQRIDLYAKRGYQTPQPIPDEVWNSFNGLVSMGFDSQVIRD